MADTSISRDAVENVPKDWKLPAGGDFVLKTVEANLNGSGAAGAYLPALQLLNPAGAVVWTAVPDSAVPAGESVLVSWFRGVDEATIDIDAAVAAAAITSLSSPTATISVGSPTGPAATVDLPTSGVGAGTYGNASNVGQFTVNAEGVVTAAANVAIGASVVTGADGWIDDTAETWTFATATTFTVAGDLRSKYTVGTRIKLTQTTIKYFTVAANPTFAGGNTTVTITGGSDYTFVNAAVSANFHSYVANPQGYPGWFNWAASPTGFSGTPSAFARFAVVGRTCYIYIDFSGTSNATTIGFTLPCAVGPGQTDGPFLTLGYAKDNATNQAAPSSVVLPAAGSTAATVQKSFNVPAWTNTGAKQTFGTTFYEI